MTRTIGILGGSFNPPHIGHMSLARFARDEAELDKVLFIPAKIPPHKRLPSGTPCAEDRLRMTEIAVKGFERGEVSDIELRREGLSYTSVTLEQLHDLYPDVRLRLIVGTDMLCTLTQWHKPETVLSLASVAVAARGEDDYARLYRSSRELEEKYGADITVMRTDIVDISSTRLRELLKEGKGEEYLPKGVYDYIRERRLYGIG